MTLPAAPSAPPASAWKRAQLCHTHVEGGRQSSHRGLWNCMPTAENKYRAHGGAGALYRVRRLQGTALGHDLAPADALRRHGHSAGVVAGVQVRGLEGLAPVAVQLQERLVRQAREAWECLRDLFQGRLSQGLHDYDREGVCMCA